MRAATIFSMALMLGLQNAGLALEDSTGIASGSAGGAAQAGCTDEPSQWMLDNDKSCLDWTEMTTRLCKNSDPQTTEGADWQEKKYCQQSCFTKGVGYEGDSCSPAPAPVTTLSTPPASLYIPKMENM